MTARRDRTRERLVRQCRDAELTMLRLQGPRIVDMVAEAVGMPLPNSSPRRFDYLDAKAAYEQAARAIRAYDWEAREAAQEHEDE